METEEIPQARNFGEYEQAVNQKLIDKKSALMSELEQLKKRQLEIKDSLTINLDINDRMITQFGDLVKRVKKQKNHYKNEYNLLNKQVSDMKAGVKENRNIFSENEMDTEVGEIYHTNEKNLEVKEMAILNPIISYIRDKFVHHLFKPDKWISTGISGYTQIDEHQKELEKKFDFPFPLLYLDHFIHSSSTNNSYIENKPFNLKMGMDKLQENIKSLVENKYILSSYIIKKNILIKRIISTNSYTGAAEIGALGTQEYFFLIITYRSIYLIISDPDAESKYKLFRYILKKPMTNYSVSLLKNTHFTEPILILQRIIGYSSGLSPSYGTEPKFIYKSNVNISTLELQIDIALMNEEDDSKEMKNEIMNQYKLYYDKND
jgi:hypothetical protein